MKNRHEIPERLVIRKSRFRFSDLLYIGGFLFFGHLIFQVDEINIILILFVAMLGFVVLTIIQRLKDDAEQIVIDKDGITLNCINKELIKWKSIKYAYIKRTVVGVGKSTRIKDWFHVETTSEKFTIEMSDFSFNSELLTQCINCFSGREIGCISNKLTQNASGLFKGKGLADDAYRIFNAYYKRQMILGTIIPLSLLTIAIYCQVRMDFPYVFAIGWTVTILTSVILGVYEDRKLRKHTLFIDLDDKSFKKVVSEFGKEFAYSTKNSIVYIVFLGITILLVFGISYILSKQ